MEKSKKLFSKSLIYGCLFLLSAFAPAWAFASEDAPSQEGKKFDPKSMILHHIMDDYGWHIADYTGDDGLEHHVTIPLPIILYTEGSLDMFLSNAFHHGEHTVTKGDREYKLDHGHIVEVNGKSVLDFSITKNVASMIVSVILMGLLLFTAASGYKKRPGQAPKGLQSLLEPIIVYLRDDVIKPNIGEKKYEKYMVFLVCMFFFIWINNLVGLVPTGANTSGNIAFTGTMAVFTLLITNFSGNKHYWGHIFWTPGVPLPLRIIMIPIEFLGIFTKPFALMVRLFANMTAGHIVLLSLWSFVFLFESFFVALPVGFLAFVMLILKIFVALLQAYVFTMLTALFIGMAVEEHH
ncbi:F0F1 ATP synthase subunit A [Rapidithrix thailandica]|uniref:ATP synthase subunit a n=1 Tax=Rapidithrix thailandica TaxID=413964 RepID=A0AAW9RZZ7_9BACT